MATKGFRGSEHTRYYLQHTRKDTLGMSQTTGQFPALYDNQRRPKPTRKPKKK